MMPARRMHRTTTDVSVTQSSVGQRNRRVSVIIPLYNHEGFIAAAIDSAMAQGPLLREIIVVDDGSSDGSAEIVRDLAAANPEIVFWSQPNRGAHAAINAGLHRATGELVAILNSDDRYASDRLQQLVGRLDADPGTDLVASGITFIDGQGAALANPWYEAAVDFYRQCGDPAAALINGNFLMSTSNFVFRRVVFEALGGFANLRYAHDLDFALRLLARQRRIVLAEAPLLQYRMHATNTIDEGHDRVKVEWIAATAFFLTCLWDRGDSGPMDWDRARRLLDVMDRHALTGPVQLCMVYFRRHPTDTLECNPFLTDRAFQEYLRKMIS